MGSEREDSASLRGSGHEASSARFLTLGHFTSPTVKRSSLPLDSRYPTHSFLLSPGSVHIASGRDESFGSRPHLFAGYDRSQCGWVFTASDPLVGDTIKKMKQLYEGKHDSEFGVHVGGTTPIHN